MSEADTGDPTPVPEEPKPTDEDLVRRAAAGDDVAFRVLVDRRLRSLTARVRKRIPAILRRKVSESDVVQAAFFTAYQKLPEFEDRGEGSFGRWLGEIAEFKVRDLLKRYRGTAKRRIDREISGDLRGRPEQVRSREPSPSSAAMATELRGRAAAAMARLPDHYREVLRLVQDEGLGLAEVGERTGRSAKAVSKLYGRAVNLLAKLVFEEGRQTHDAGDPDR